jgi:hypothetical protein
MKWFKSLQNSFNPQRERQKEASRSTSMTYYYVHRDEILAKRKQRYEETGK